MSSPITNPFPGLRPFRADEDYLFFGREEQTLELVGLLREHRFLAVVGTSGSGKSSLVRAGLLPALHGGTMVQAGSTWEVVVMKPGGAPIENLARALIEADFYDVEDPESQLRLEATLNRSRQGLVEAIRQSDADPEANVLVVIDQFEELFRFRQRGLGFQEAAGAFVDLLLHASDQAEHPIFIAITMRSDYLGDCAQIPGLAEAVNDGEYLIPRLRRQQRRDAIEKPVHVGGGTIAERLVQRLLNDVGDDADQLPVLQHALMRTWDVWTEDRAPDEPIDLRHYQAAGGMDRALSLHADSVFASLPDDDHRRVAERLFKVLTERTLDNREIRRPKRLEKLVAIAGTEPAVVATVLEAYRKPGVTFLMPTTEVELAGDTVVDISHESLMRVWSRLRNWVDEEAQSARIYHRLVDTARLWEDRRAGLFHDPDLGIAQAWREENAPNAAWADLYGGGFDLASRFLDESRAAAERDEREREEARQRELEQARALAESQARTATLLKRFAATVAAALVVAVGLTIWAFRLEGIAKEKSLEAAAESERANELKIEADEAKIRSQLFQGKTSLAMARAAQGDKEHFHARLLAGRAIGFSKLGAEGEPETFREAFPVLIPPDVREHGEAAQLARTSGHPAVPAWLQPGIRHHPGSINDVAIHPNGRIAASCSESDTGGTGIEDAIAVHIWDLESGRRLQVIEGHTRDVEALAFSHDGALLASAGDDGDNTIVLWDTGTWTVRKRLLLYANGIHAVAFSPDDRFLASGDEDGRVFLIDLTADLPAEQVVEGIQVHDTNQRIGHVAWSPDGATLATSGFDGTIKLLDAATLEVRHTIVVAMAGRDANLEVETFAFAPDGSWLVASGERTAPTIWDLASGEPKPMASVLEARLEAVDRQGVPGVDSVAVSDDGQRLAVAWGDQRFRRSEEADVAARPTVSIFDVSEPSRPVLLHDHFGHMNRTRALEFAPGSRRYLSGDEVGVLLTNDADTPPGELSFPPVHAAGHLRTLAVSPDGQWLFTGDVTGRMLLWDAARGAVHTELADVGDRCEDAVFSRDGKVLFTAAYRTGSIHAWAIPSGSLLQSETFDHTVRHLALDPQGAVLAVSGNDSSIAFYDVHSGGAMPLSPATIIDRPRSNWAGVLDFLPDGRLLVATSVSSTNAVIEVFKREESDGTWFLQSSQDEIHANYISSIAAAPNGNRFATSAWTDGARFWSIAPDGAIKLIPGIVLREIESGVTHVAFSPDGSRFLTCDGPHVHVWDADTGALVTTLSEPANPRQAAFTPDGRYIASVMVDGSVHLWDLGRDDVIARRSDLDGSVAGMEGEFPAGACGLAFLDGDGTLAIGGGFRDLPTSIRLWDLESGSDTRTLPMPPGARVAMLAHHPGTRRLAASTTTGQEPTSTGALYLFDLAAEERAPANPAVLFEGAGVVSVAFHPDGDAIAAAFTDRVVRLFAVPPPGSPIMPSAGTIVTDVPAMAYREVEFTPDGSRLLVGGREGIEIFPFDRETHRLGERGLLAHPFAWAATIGSDGAIIASASVLSREIRLWDANTLKPIGPTLRSEFRPLGLAISPDGRLLSVNGLDDGLLLFDISDPGSPVTAADLSPQGATDGAPVRFATFSADSSALAATRQDGSVTVFRLRLSPADSHLTRYLEALGFDGGGGVAWRDLTATSLTAPLTPFPPESAVDPYLGVLATASSASPDERARLLFAHHLANRQLGAAEAALEGFPEATPPSTEDWQRFAALLEAEIRDVLQGDSTQYTMDQLTGMAARIEAHAPISPDIRLAFLVGADQWTEAQAFLLSTLPDLESDERNAFVDRFFRELASAIDPTRHVTQESIGGTTTPSALPSHLLLATVVRDIAEDTLRRWEPSYPDRLTPPLGASTDSALWSELMVRALDARPPIVPPGSEWKYYDGDNPPPAGWTLPGFDDASWPSGPADIGFGHDADEPQLHRTILPESLEGRMTYYFRHTFEVEELPAAGTLTLLLQRDDAAAVYLNGVEIVRDGLPEGPLSADTPASRTPVGGEDEATFFPHTIPADALVVGANTLAVEVHQTSATSSDIHLDLALMGTSVVPRSALEKLVGLAKGLSETGFTHPILDLALAIAQADSTASESDEDPVVLVARSRLQNLLVDREAEMATLERAAALLADSADPADWRRYRDVLRRQEFLLRQSGRSEDAVLVRDKIETVPPRPAGLSADQLDLEPFHNATVYEPRGWNIRFAGIDLRSLPATLEPHDGIDFDARCIVQLDSGVYEAAPNVQEALAGQSFATLSRRPYPPRVDGIPVGREIRALHLLGAALHNRAEPGTEIARIILNYADGTSHSVPLILEGNFFPLWSDNVLGPPDQIAWRGPNGTEKPNAFQLTHVVCENPSPDKLVASFDFVSSEAAAAPFIVAATVEGEPR